MGFPSGNEPSEVWLVCVLRRGGLLKPQVEGLKAADLQAIGEVPLPPSGSLPQWHSGKAIAAAGNEGRAEIPLLEPQDGGCHTLVERQEKPGGFAR